MIAGRWGAVLRTSLVVHGPSAVRDDDLTVGRGGGRPHGRASASDDVAHGGNDVAALVHDRLRWAGRSSSARFDSGFVVPVLVADEVDRDRVADLPLVQPHELLQEAFDFARLRGSDGGIRVDALGGQDSVPLASWHRPMCAAMRITVCCSPGSTESGLPEPIVSSTSSLSARGGATRWPWTRRRRVAAGCESWADDSLGQLMKMNARKRMPATIFDMSVPRNPFHHGLRICQ